MTQEELADTGLVTGAMQGPGAEAGAIVATAENKPVDDPLVGTFTWNVEEWSRVQNRDRKMYSEIFSVGGFKWRILLFPKGNNADFLSVYLDVPDAEHLAFGWQRFASFNLTVHDQLHGEPPGNSAMKKETQHNFHGKESDWGFTQFMLLSDLSDPARGHIVNDTLIITCEIQVRKKESDYYMYDSRKETGYVGLKNQGATCYMNSLLQTLFHIPYFRKAVYHMPTTENDTMSKSIPLALQSLFYKVQFSENSVATKDLTKSFGWDAYDSFLQHDVQELNRVLCDKIDEKMKATSVEGTIQQLFEGKVLSYIECVDVDFKSTRQETFLDLQLDVKGCKDVYASFDKYVEVEMMDGDNKYEADGHGMQDARKGVLFEEFPPVLELQLKRFEYDFARDTMVKINDRYEFPDKLDLDVGGGKYLTKDADRSVRNLYTLHSVLVHSGTVHGGHYYAFIRPDMDKGDSGWLKFDDERVTKEDAKKALDEQFGGEEEGPPQGLNNSPPAAFHKFTKVSNAYMLVYIRDQDKERMMCEVKESDIADHLRERLAAEKEEKEKKRKEKAEAHLYTIVKVARDADLSAQIGQENSYFDLVDHEKVQSFRVQKHIPFLDFKEQIVRELGIPLENQRYWLWAKRQNHTYRPSRPLKYEEEEKHQVQLIKDVAMGAKQLQTDLKLFLEEPLPGDGGVLPPITRGVILLFFKMFDPEKGELRYVGRTFANTNGKMADLRPLMCQLGGMAADEDIAMFEEIKFEPQVMCESIDQRMTLKSCQLEDGDIIVFQKLLPPEKAVEVQFPLVPDFLEYVRNRQVVHLRRIDKIKEDEHTLEMSKQHKYDEVVAMIAKAVGVEDPTTIRLTAHNCYTNVPKPQAIKYRGLEKLQDMLVHFNQVADIIYYEVLDLPLPELERLKTLKVTFHNGKAEEVGTHNIRLPKESNVGDVLDDLAGKLKEAGTELRGPLRLLEVFYSKIYKDFPREEKIDAINDQYWTLRAEEVSAEEAGAGPNDRQLHVYHFHRQQEHASMIHNFGDPFLLMIGAEEPLSSIKGRIQSKLEVADEEFAKWKFAFVSHSRPEYLEEDDIVAKRTVRRDNSTAWNEHYLGMEHEDKTPKRPHTNQGNRNYSYEKPVKINN